MTREICLAAAAAAALAALTACTAAQAPRPNILILLMDTLRADRLGCYGYGKATSPTVDQLAERGTLFTRCYAPSDYTQASTASLFTGQYPLAHGYVNSDYVLEDANLTMAEILRGAGYTTAAFIANGLAGRKYRMDQGFHEHFEKNRASAFELAAAAREFIIRQSPSGRPFLAYLHFLDVHDPHRIPAAEFSRLADPAAFVFDMQDTLLLESMVMRAWWSTVQKWRDDVDNQGEVDRYFEDYSDLYDSSIAYWDEAVGSILETLARNGLDRNTVVVVTSDHGEQLLEHGFFGHANSGYDVGLHVPLVIFDPAEDGSGRRISRPVSLIDVLPTLLARAGMPVPEQVQGRSLWPFSRAGGTSGTDARFIYSEGTFFANRPVGTLIQTLREGRWKLILDRLRDSKELYDLSRDPGETRNLLATETDVAARLYGELQRHYNTNLDIFDARQRSQAGRTAEKLRELRSLGYITPPGPRRHRLPAQYFPMAGAAVHRFGPFGDEEDLHLFSDHLDLTRPGQAALGQIIRGCSEDPARADGTGLWFDRRSTFLLHNDGAKGRVRFEIAVDPGAPAAPTAIQVEFNDTPGQVFPVEGTGRFRVEAPLPDSLRRAGVLLHGAARRQPLRPAPGALAANAPLGVPQDPRRPTPGVSGSPGASRANPSRPPRGIQRSLTPPASAAPAAPCRPRGP